MSQATLTKPSEKQVALIKSLLSEREHQYEVDFTTLSGGYGGSASTLISALFKCPKVAKIPAAKKAEPATGIYKVHKDGEVKVYKVYTMVHGSGRQGVKGLSVKNLSDGTAEGVFSYLGLAVKFLPADAVKMPKAEAVAYGKIYGFCVRCGKTLTDDKSIAAGMGPWCSSQEW